MITRSLGPTNGALVAAGRVRVEFPSKATNYVTDVPALEGLGFPPPHRLESEETLRPNRAERWLHSGVHVGIPGCPGPPRRGFGQRRVAGPCSWI